MDYVKNNKTAWEEAFENRRPGWGDDNDRILKKEGLPFFCAEVAIELKRMDLAGKTVAQFCCNNGRELLSLMRLGPIRGTGFDIAENIIGQARLTAKKADIVNCDFIACGIQDIGEEYHDQFDFIFFTIGAVTWFDDLNRLFEKVAKCLKQNGQLMIHDFHPFMNMLPTPGEDSFDAENLNRITYSYFKKEPWIENNGMGYMTPPYESKTFTSFSHTLSDIINSVIGTGMRIEKLNEYDRDVGLTDVYDKKGYPLSYLLFARK